jgi:two-component system response regulator LytT
MTRVLIVEDEAPAHRRLSRLVRATAGYETADVVVAESLREAHVQLEEATWDVILLDLELGGRDGFDLVGRVPAASPAQIIIVSANTQRAIEAFEHAVVDFVRKPVSAARLARALMRVPRADSPPAPTSLIVRRRGNVELVRLDSVVCLSGADDYVELLLRDGRRLLHDATLDTLAGLLPDNFMRVHRSHLVNLMHAERVHGASGGERMVELVGGVRVPVSRRRHMETEERLRTVRGLPPSRG